MNTLLVVVILISGYVYVIRSLSDRYQFKRSTGWDAYFLVAAWGTFFVTLSWAICSFLSITGFLRWGVNGAIEFFGADSNVISRVFPLSAEDATRFRDLKFALCGLMSLAMAYTVGGLKKLWLKNANRRIDALVKAVGDNALENMLMEASATQMPIIATLKSRKFYVGFVFCPAFEHGTFDYLELLPLLSGYRDKDKLTITITTKYNEHYEKSGILNGKSDLELSDFRVLIPKAEIENISFFDFDTYSVFKSEEDKEQKSKGLMGKLRGLNK
ncbi:hypothetical protein IT786_18695 [Enterobacter hormaechei]|uniref:hypothetical protein n=1 Tax=Enterobacter hormaechei TaxID=158836 RepID=UPI00189B8FF4|nr:hypothetical protein [Enterobacter hormaechei]QPD65649.1 hypothetical protein IT786_18695 [Enterobacter hormaechei]